MDRRTTTLSSLCNHLLVSANTLDTRMQVFRGGLSCDGSIEKEPSGMYLKVTQEARDELEEILFGLEWLQWQLDPASKEKAAENGYDPNLIAYLTRKVIGPHAKEYEHQASVLSQILLGEAEPGDARRRQVPIEEFYHTLQTAITVINNSCEKLHRAGNGHASTVTQAMREGTGRVLREITSLLPYLKEVAHRTTSIESDYLS